MLYKKTRDVISPERAHSKDSGIDFFVPKNLGFITNQFGKKIKPILVKEDGTEVFHIYPGDNVRIPLGVSVSIPGGHDLQFVNKSGIASKRGLILGASLVDNGYTGEIILNLINAGSAISEITSDLKVAQGVIRKVEYVAPLEVEELNIESERGEGGFGSTGV